MYKITQENAVAAAVSNADVTTERISSYVSVANVRRLYAIAAVMATLGSGKTFTVQLKQATDSSGTSAKNLGTATVLTDATAAQTAEVDAFAEDLDLANGFNYVALSIVSNNASGVGGWGRLITDHSRYNG